MIRNMGDTLAVCPPFIITSSQIETLVDGIAAALQDVSIQVRK
jgi:4-aminobutyrate--pyruvate transaminase